jgi:LysR family transcriptional regulator for metE and metH
VLPQLAHAEERIHQFAQGRARQPAHRHGMPSLLPVAAQGGVALSRRWPDVDVDVKQKFQFGGIGALFGYEIDLLVTPDPLYKPGLRFEPVFDYEQVLVVDGEHALAAALRQAR